VTSRVAAAEQSHMHGIMLVVPVIVPDNCPTITVCLLIILFDGSSGMGPLLYASDLRPGQDNIIADDTYLIVPDSNIQTIPMEMQRISEWAMRHNLKLNETKSQLSENPRQLT